MSKMSLAEMFAERIVDLDMLDSANRNDSFAEFLAQIIVDNLPENVELTDSEWAWLNNHLEDFVEDNLEDEAVGIVHEWNEDAREAYLERQEAMKGRY